MTVDEPPTEARDIALGRYMAAWSDLESALRHLVREILGIDADSAHVVLAAIPVFQSIKVLEALAKLKFTDAGHRRTIKLCEQLVRRNIRRNQIVHGAWQHRLSLDPVSGAWETGEWRREYDQIDPDFPSAARGTSLTVPEIDKTTDHVSETVEVLWSLVQDIPALLFRPQVPGQ